MLDARFLSENLTAYKTALKKRGSKINLDEIVSLDAQRRKLISEIEKLRAQRNNLSGSLKEKPSEEIIAQGRDLKEKIQTSEDKLSSLEEQLGVLVMSIPNLVHADSPLGPEENKKTLRTNGKPTQFDFAPVDHEELGKKLDLIDFERGAKVAGSKFYYLKNEAVLLEFALINFALAKLTKEGFIPVITPEIIKDSVLRGMGFQPRGPETQMYGIENTDLSLIGTSEHTLGGMHADEILETLPLKYVGFSSCFRTEAGGYGKFSKGLYRVHQFDKIEMFIYCKPDESEKMHQLLLSLEEQIWQELEIPYRVVDLSTEDLGAASYRTYDIEAWMPGRDKSDYSEVTSTSNTTDYQARRLNIRYKEGEETQHVHMLNGTALAISRALIVILENNQQKDGSILMPKALHPYLPFKVIKSK